ncbi:membrane protein [Alteribacillus persepolensis]|uniref:Membrane protein n=1 Tax=Alteribacillus persepolensis TaxID=568899 RepID=A0A1G7Z7I7_9BACI|nr:YihY/virulence factor BrkB family protein [Alteribacillus persepolensis]SDH04575.1 membrane protein [Alteribacillus persepolensis]
MQLRYIRLFVQRLRENKIFDISAQLGYYFLMAMFPLLLFILSIISFLPITSNDVLRFLSPYVPPGTLQILTYNVHTIIDVQRLDTLSFSSAATIWLSLLGTFAIIRAINHSYHLTNPPWYKMLVIGFGLMLSILLAIVLSLLLPIYGRSFGLFLFSFIGLDHYFIYAWEWFRWGVSFIVIGLVLFYIFLSVPNRKVTTKEALPGAIFALISWQAASFGFFFYVEHNDYSAIYGSLGNIIVLMVWFYISGFSILAGGQLNAMIAERRP